MEILSEKIRTARKIHRCDACHLWNYVGLGDSEIDADDRPIIEEAKADDWKIKPGMEYREVVYKDDGEILTYRARLDMDGLCQRYEMFDE